MKRSAALLFFASLFVSACSERAQFANGCLVDGDCPTGAYCRRASAAANEGICACRSDEACEAGEICNSQGVCQKQQGCRANSECELAKFCDLGSGACLDRINCGLDLHCLPGQVCNLQNKTCVDGCLDHADCPLYQICEGGRCVAGKCGDRTFCDYGERCVNNICQPVGDPNYCKDCDPQVAGSCGSPNNYCLINSSYEPGNPRTGGPNFCGVECDQANDGCPNGYDCNSVVLLTQDQCMSDNECGGGGRRCFIGEGNTRGFCSCVESSECNLNQAAPRCAFGLCEWPQGQFCTADSQCQPLPICAPAGPGGQLICVTDGSPCQSAAQCQCYNGQCINSGRACTSAQQCNLSCVDNGCLLGSACAPIQGLLCPDVRR